MWKEQLLVLVWFAGDVLGHSGEVWEHFEGAYGQFVEAFGYLEKATGCFGAMREVFEYVGEAS